MKVILMQLRNSKSPPEWPSIAELIDLASSERRQETIIDLSWFGCHVTAIGWPAGTKVQVRISHDGAIFVARGSIVSVRPVGTGVVFTEVEPKDELLLD